MFLLNKSTPVTSGKRADVDTVHLPLNATGQREVFYEGGWGGGGQ